MSLRRLARLCTALVLLAAVVVCRVYWVATNAEYAVRAGAQTEQRITLPRRRGNFYDRTGRPLTGTVTRHYALCLPGSDGYAALFPYVSYAAQTELYERRNSSAPFLVEVGDVPQQVGVQVFTACERPLPLPIAVHLLGYLDGDGNGVTGLERAYNEVLAAAYDQTAAVCTATAQGSLLSGSTPTVEVEQAGTGQGVQLTLDADIQRICEGIAEKTMPRGCIVVLDTATADVLAAVSLPQYDPRNIAESLNADDTSLIDRTLAAFSAGSVFKVVVAAAACENGLDWFTHDCTGSIEVAGQTYRCAQGRAHGQVNLRGALEQSCNAYFIRLGQLLGGEVIAETAAAFGFGTSTALAPGLSGAAGTLPDVQTLENAGQLAGFSFGQGELTVTPLQLAAMMNAVAAGGVYRAPRLVQGVVDSETMQPVEPAQTAAARTVCSAATVRVLQSMLRSVVEDGIGGEAEPAEGGSFGKTGTAQTGQFNADGEELLNYWFCGCYPADDPRYTIVVLQDGTLEPEFSSAAVFAQIADALHAYDAA